MGVQAVTAVAVVLCVWWCSRVRGGGGERGKERGLGPEGLGAVILVYVLLFPHVIICSAHLSDHLS